MSDGEAAKNETSSAEKAILDRLERLQSNPTRYANEDKRRARRNYQWSWPFRSITADRWAELLFALALTVATIVNVCIANRQWIVAARQADLSAIGQRAFIFARDVRVDRRRNPVPGTLNEFETSFWFVAVLENGGNTAAKDIRISAQAAIDPSRPDVEVKLPMGLGLGGKQHITVSHLPESGSPDPETILLADEALERQRKPSELVRPLFGAHVTQNVSGFGVPVDETLTRIRQGERLFILGAIHYYDGIPGSPQRVSKYCYILGAAITETDDLQITPSPCPHWNCADEECGDDKAAFDAETADWKEPALLRIPPSSPPSPTPPATAGRAK